MVCCYMLKEILKELKDTWDFTTEELNDLEKYFVSFGAACIMDSSVRSEVENFKFKEK